jgi:hypothetical protein
VFMNSSPVSSSPRSPALPSPQEFQRFFAESEQQKREFDERITMKIRNSAAQVAAEKLAWAKDPANPFVRQAMLRENPTSKPLSDREVTPIALLGVPEKNQPERPKLPALTNLQIDDLLYPNSNSIEFMRAEHNQEIRESVEAKVRTIFKTCSQRLKRGTKTLNPIRTAATATALAIGILAYSFPQFALPLLILFVAVAAIAMIALYFAKKHYPLDQLKEIEEASHSTEFKKILVKMLENDEEVSLGNLYELSEACKKILGYASWADEFAPRFDFPQMPAEESEDQ